MQNLIYLGSKMLELYPQVDRVPGQKSDKQDGPVHC